LDGSFAHGYSSRKIDQIFKSRPLIEIGRAHLDSENDRHSRGDLRGVVDHRKVRTLWLLQPEFGIVHARVEELKLQSVHLRERVRELLT